MWIVENRNKYISGIFKTVKSLNKYLKEVKDASMDDNQSTYQVEGQEYPIFILESEDMGRRFTFFTDRKKAEKAYADNNLTHASLYTINKDYAPPKPGIDWMGVLDHDHLGED